MDEVRNYASPVLTAVCDTKQVPACMRAPAQSPATEKRRSTTERLVSAALEVFSRDGLAATTREIARVAGVNETTLFRQFETKEQLLAAATREMMSAHVEALDKVDLEDFDLRRDLMRVAHAFDHSITKHERFIRTMMGQTVDPGLREQIMREVVEPLRSRFIAWLAEGQRRNLVRDLDLAPAVDVFTATIFTGALRRSVCHIRYSREHYIETCVDIFLAGIRQ